MSLQTFLNQEASGDCTKAIAPVVAQAFLDIPEATGDTIQDLVPALATGDVALFSGNVVNSGCMDLRLTISYVDGQDCDVCTSDTLVLLEVPYLVKKNRHSPLPTGLIAQVQVETGNVDAAGVFTPAAVPTGQVQSIEFDSCYQPCCGTIALVP